MAEKKISKKKAAKKKRENLITNSIALVNILAVLLILSIGFIYLLFLKRDTVSHEENRNLAKFPKFTVSSYLKGEYTENIANYYNDTVPNRSFFKTLISTKLLPLKGRKYGGNGDDGVELYGNAFEHKKPKPTEPVTEQTQTTVSGDISAETTTTTTATTIPDKYDPAAADGEVSNNILVVNKRGIMLYGGGWGTELEYAEYVNAYKEKLGKKVNVYSMVLPTNVSFYLPKNYADLAESEKADFDNIDKALKDVVSVDAYTALLMHKKEAIYSRTDHHWQPLGAYYAAQAFAEAADVPFADLSEYNKKVLKGYVGTLYGYTNSQTLKENPEDFIYYEPKAKLKVTRYSTYFTDPEETELFLDPDTLSESSYYLVFGMDDRITHVQTECKNGRTLVIFKDSYGNALLPVLTSSFENIYLCDVRYFDLNAIDFIKQVKATDVLFTMCSYSAVGENRKCIYNNMNK